MTNNERIQAHNLLIDQAQAKVDALPDATELPELASPGSAADLRTGKQLIDADGNVIDGTMPEVAVPVPAITPDLTSGKVSVSSTQSAGYTPGGTKTGEFAFTTQRAKVVTPSKGKQTAVAAYRYTTGAVEVDPIPDEYIIPSGTQTITGNGTYDVTEKSAVEVDVPVEDLTAALDEQEALITELETVLAGKAGGGSGGGVNLETVSLTIESAVGKGEEIKFQDGTGKYIIVRPGNGEIIHTECVKDSLIAIFTGMVVSFDVAVDGGADLVVENGVRVYEIYGDATISLESQR